jgi:hypothetical protein
MTDADTVNAVCIFVGTEVTVLANLPDAEFGD